MVTFGYSSGGAREHILFRSQNYTVFIVFRTADRGDRIYYLRKEMLYDVFEGYGGEIPDFEEHGNSPDDE
jgi:hypothetical protein